MANETLINDVVAREAMQQLEELDRAMVGTLQQFQNCARELAQGLKVPVEVTGDVDALRTLTNSVMRDAQQATQQLTQQLQQQQQVVANTTNTISRQLQAQENLNKAQREAFTQDQQAQDLAKALLGTRQQNYELLARYTAEMKANKDAQKQVNEQEKQGLITAEQAIQRRATLMAAYDKTKFAAQELTKILAAENKEANAVQGSYQQLSQKLERLKMAYKQMTDAQKASAGGKELEKEIQNLDAHLKDLSADMGEHQRNVGNYAIAAQSMKSTLRELTEEIAQLTLQYQEMSDEEQRSDIGMQMRDKITELTEQAGKYKDVISDVKQSISGSASDTRLFDSLIEAGQVFAATMGVAETACRALGMSEDNLQKSMLKVQQAMQAVQALQVIQNTLQKQSNLMKGIAIIQSKAAAAAARIEATATASATGATKAQTVAQAAFNAVAKANPYVLLATAILAVIGLIVGYTSATEDATEADKAAKEAADARKESMDNYAQSFGQQAGEMLAKYNALREEWNALGNDINAKRQYLVQHKNDFIAVANAAGMGADSVADVNSAEKNVIKNTSNVEAAIQRRARAMAAYAEVVRILQKMLADLEKANTVTYTSYKGGAKVYASELKKYGIALTPEQQGKTASPTPGEFAGSTEAAVAAMGQYYATGGGKVELTASQALALTNKLKEAAIAEGKKQMDKIRADADAEIKRTLNRAGFGSIGETYAAANGPISGGGSTGGGRKPTGGSRKTGTTKSGGAAKSNQEQAKEEKELQDMLLEILIDANKRKTKVVKEYSEEWKNLMLEGIVEAKDKDLIENKDKYKSYMEDLKKSLSQRKITQDEYNALAIQAEKVFVERGKAIQQAYADEVVKINAEMATHKLEELAKSHEKEIEDINSQTAEQLDIERARYRKEIEDAQGNAEKIESIRKTHAKHVEDIETAGAVRVALATIESLEKQLEMEDISAEEREKISKGLAEAKRDYDKMTTENLEKALDEQVEAEKEAAEKQKEIEDQRQELIEKWIDTIADGIGKVSELMGAMYDNQISKVEQLIEEEQQRYEAEVNHIDWLADRGAITTEEAEIRKRDAAERTAKAQEALEKKKSALEYKKAIIEKANSAVQAVIATALAVTKALPNIPLAAVVGALGAVQVATILAQPIQKYAEGTKGKGHPGGLAIVGDAGKQEIVMYGKRAWITPDSPTLVDLPKGAEVMPDASKVDLVQMGSSLFMTLPKSKGGGGPIIVNDYEALEGRVATNTKAVTAELRGGFRSMKRELRRQNFRNYINART